ncbi:ABC transporter permease [Nocardioides sp.]|uniref:ABC transporter permease n=1 Tax=Nocardioides sp. TaxID=35761 RepID=UPI003D0A244B
MTEVVIRRAAARRPGGTAAAVLRRPGGFIGAGLVLVVVAVAFVGPLLGGTPGEFVASPFATPGGGHVFGADNLGRDVLALFLSGGRRLLIIVFFATVIGVSAGACVGLVIGVSRGRVARLMLAAVDVYLAFPFYLFILIFVAVVGSNLVGVVLVVAIVHVAPVARVVRPVVAEVSQRDFVQASRAIGVPRRKILLGEILPNVVPTLSVEYGIRLVFSVGIVTGLSFLGFGTPPGTPDWGRMIADNQIGLTVQPWPVILPCVAIALLSVGANMVTDTVARATGIGDS